MLSNKRLSPSQNGWIYTEIDYTYIYKLGDFVKHLDLFKE